MVRVMNSILHFILSLAPVIIYYSTKKPIINNYNLRKDFKLKDVKTKVLPNEVLRKYSDIDERKFLEQKFGSSIVDFISVIKKQVPNSDLSLLFNNFNNLEIATRNFKVINFLSDKKVGAWWIPTDDKIELSESNYKYTINHELLHVASTFVDKVTKTIYCGFEQTKNNINIGEGLNEGYTQYLAEKYFKDSLKAYAYEKRIAQAVELIIGIDKMRSLYFNANLNGLIGELCQYNTEENVYEFIKTLDFINKHINDKKLTPKSNQMLLDCFKKNNLFLIQTFTNKIIKEYPNNEIDIRELIDKLLPIITIVPSKIDKKHKTKVIMSEDDLKEIVNHSITNYSYVSKEKTIKK